MTFLNRAIVFHLKNSLAIVEMNSKKISSLRCIAIDDEFSCNEILVAYCKEIPSLNMIATFTDPLKAVPLLESGGIDLIFLDFNMGSMKAPAFMKYVPEQCQVIILSADLKSVIRDYEMRITDILSKPYTMKHLLDSVGKAIRIVAKSQN